MTKLRVFARLLPGWVLLAIVLQLAPARVGAADFLDEDYYEQQEGAGAIYDPIEPLNRAFFTFNDTLFVWVLNPVAKGYSHIVPADIRGCVGNFFRNLEEPPRAINCLLQGRFRDAGRVVSRFFINTTCGVFGLADPAAREFELAPVRANLGETLATWGVGDGFYLVMPLFGPSTLRDFTGTMVDSMAMTPYYSWNDDVLTTVLINSGNNVNRISLRLGEYEKIKSLSFDPYIAFRDGYFQLRERFRNRSEAQYSN